MGIRKDIIHEASHEAEKNKEIRYETIKGVEFCQTHAKVFISDRYNEDGDYQPVFLINADLSKMPNNIIKDYGVIVLSSSAGRYEEAVGILIRKGGFDRKENKIRTKLL